MERQLALARGQIAAPERPPDEDVSAVCSAALLFPCFPLRVGNHI